MDISTKSTMEERIAARWERIKARRQREGMRTLNKPILYHRNVVMLLLSFIQYSMLIIPPIIKLNHCCVYRRQIQRTRFGGFGWRR